jgi:hypothetical protein
MCNSSLTTMCRYAKPGTADLPCWLAARGIRFRTGVHRPSASQQTLGFQWSCATRIVDLIGRAVEMKGAKRRCIASFATDASDWRPSRASSAGPRACRIGSERRHPGRARRASRDHASMVLEIRGRRAGPVLDPAAESSGRHLAALRTGTRGIDAARDAGAAAGRPAGLDQPLRSAGRRAPGGEAPLESGLGRRDPSRRRRRSASTGTLFRADLRAANRDPTGGADSAARRELGSTLGRGQKFRDLPV